MLCWAISTGAKAEGPAAEFRAPDFFKAHPVSRIQIQLSQEAIAALRKDGREYVRATIRGEGEVFRDAGLHLKGKGGFRGLDDKPSLTLDFQHFSRERTFHGLQKIHLNNSVEDASFVNELIGSELFRAAGVPAPKVAHALVALNGRPLGLYVLKEGFTQDFLQRSFRRAGGDLFEPVDGHDVDQPMKRQSRDEADDSSGPQLLAAAAQEPNLERRWERLQEVLDLDRFLAFIAVEVMTCHWDGYALARNNFRLSRDPATDNMVFLPTGLDQLFGNARMPWKPEMSGLVARAVMETPEGQQKYAATFRRLFAGQFRSELLTNRVNRIVIGLRPFLKASAFHQVRQETADICAQIVEREVWLRKQLHRPERPLM